MKSSPKSFEALVEALQALPALGRKSAIKLAYHILIENPTLGVRLAHSIEQGLYNIKKCKICGNVAEHELCEVCADDERDSKILCIVSSPKDILVIEQSGAFKGKYFIVHSANDKALEHLFGVVSKGVQEILFAFTPCVESDVLISFLEEKLKHYPLNFTKIAQGVPTGISLENVDALSLSKAFSGRIKA